MNPASIMPLSLVSSGRSVILKRVQAGCGLASRLTAMGLLPGAKLQVYINNKRGPVIIGLHGNRVILGRGMAEKVSVLNQ